ncbi:MAG: hypothetical protein ACRDQX_07055 [Pseudonocardiaceae bacterium]
MGSYEVTYRDGERHMRGTVTVEELLDLNERGQLVAVHSPVDDAGATGARGIGGEGQRDSSSS